MAGASDDSAKVSAIRATILAQARAQAEAAVSAAEAEAAAHLAERKRAVDDWVKERTRAAREAADKERRTRVAAAATAARSRVLGARTAVLEEATAAVLARLAAVRTRSDYPEMLKAMLVEAALAVAPAATEEALEVQIDERDAATVTSDFLGSVEIVLTFTHSLGVHFLLAPERIETAGGVVVAVKNSNVRCANTLEERLAAHKPALMREVFEDVLRAGFSDGTH